MKRFSILGILVALMAATLWAAAPVLAEKSSAKEKAVLDGLTFEGEATDDTGKKLEDKDMLIFNHGHFLSTECRQMGFTKASYMAKATDKGTQFDATTTSPANGTMIWTGLVNGGSITCSCKWTDKDGKVTTYMFTGMLLP